MNKIPKAYSYNDIGLVPRITSTLKHRNEADISADFCGVKLKVPIISSPMPDVTNGIMAWKLASLGAMGVIHRFQSIEEQTKQYGFNEVEFTQSELDCRLGEFRKRISCAIGATGDYQIRLEKLYDAGCRIFCIDTANGANIQVEESINWIRKSFQKDVYIIAGNVASREGFKYLSDIGADVIRVGIAGGCFTPDMNVECQSGPKCISNVQIGDFVYSHDGTLNEVIDKLEFNRNEEILSINGIECTKNHEFYVLNKKYKDIVTESNIEEYAEWISAKNLTDKFFLIKSS